VVSLDSLATSVYLEIVHYKQVCGLVPLKQISPNFMPWKLWQPGGPRWFWSFHSFGAILTDLHDVFQLSRQSWLPRWVFFSLRHLVINPLMSLMEFVKHTGKEGSWDHRMWTSHQHSLLISQLRGNWEVWLALGLWTVCLQSPASSLVHVRSKKRYCIILILKLCTRKGSSSSHLALKRGTTGLCSIST